MSNHNALSLYLVTEGRVESADADVEWDGTCRVLVAATSEAAALKVADAYDRGDAEADNLQWEGRTIAVVTLRDRATGDFL